MIVSLLDRGKAVTINKIYTDDNGPQVLEKLLWPEGPSARTAAMQTRTASIN